MDPKQMFKQIIDFNKTTFDNGFNALVMFQNQAETTVNTLMEQAPWLPEEGRKVIRQWIDTCKKGRDDFKKAMDESFTKVESFFGDLGEGKSSETS
jgi:hypothetical protein